ncbi:Plus-3 domain-containing protein [Apiospora rasikravindrae]|uniref:Plus-3 domain-containing protein n=1 Tax=Apiospora rasikravindrae TaxID=990691 RepID=A0ABR1TDN0_9PEZI
MSDDLDDQLMALVGGDEDSDEGSDQEMNISRSGSESPDPKKSKKAAPAKKAKKRKQDYSDEEEGEASSDAESVASQESAPMDESDSEAGSPAGNNTAVFDDEENKYPHEGMFASEQEKEDIMGMREVERESILAERMQEIERQRQNRLLRQLVGDNDKKAAKKRKANDAELEDAQRKTSRQRTKIGGNKVGETSSGIESLRRARAEKSDRQRRLAEDRERNKDKHTSFSRDSPGDDRDDDSDIEWSRDDRRRSRSRTPEQKEAPPADLRDIERVRLSRSRFGQICFFPGFEDAITGCFVRISIGPDSRDPRGGNVYRMAVIKRFTTGKPYAMEKKTGQPFVTDQYVVAAHGKAEREWPFIVCSESPFTESEFNRYKATVTSEGGIFPKQPALVAKIDDINKLLNRSWTDTELDEKLQRERALRDKFNPAERNRLANAIEAAKEKGDMDKATQLQEQLDQIETPRLAFKTSLTANKKVSSANSQQDRLAQVNAENRKRNAEAVRKAQLREKAKARDIENRIARGEEVKEDTSRRLRTQPKFLLDHNEVEERVKTGTSGASTPANGTPKLNASGNGNRPLPPHIAKLQQNQSQNGTENGGMPQIHRPLVDDDIIGSLDLDIDVEID